MTQFDGKNLRFRRKPRNTARVVLQPGGTMSANDLVKNFLGRAQNIAALKAWMSEQFQAAAAK